MRHHDYDDDPYVVIEKHSGGVSTFLIGLAVGAGLALLFAPQSGVETRRRIARTARRAQQAAADAVGDVTDRVTETFDTARARVAERIDEAREAIEVKVGHVEQAVVAGREAARQARTDLERRLAETKAAYGAGAQVARDARAERALARMPKDETPTV
jgi:gas vesicle protein